MNQKSGVASIMPDALFLLLLLLHPLLYHIQLLYLVFLIRLQSTGQSDIAGIHILNDDKVKVNWSYAGNAHQQTLVHRNNSQTETAHQQKLLTNRSRWLSEMITNRICLTETVGRIYYY